MVTHNLPWVIDEEYGYFLTIVFIDTQQAKLQRKLDLSTDTAIVNVKPYFESVWVWDAPLNRNGITNGSIKIKHWGAKKIRLHENISVNVPGTKKKRKFKGTRTFRIYEKSHE
jgi:hypothetical protein